MKGLCASVLGKKHLRKVSLPLIEIADVGVAEAEMDKAGAPSPAAPDVFLWPTPALS